MTRTPSRTATANDDGTYVAPHICAPRGFVGRQLQANLRSEEHESHMRQYRAGRGRMEVQNPQVIQMPALYMWRICGEKVTRLTPGELSICWQNGQLVKP